MPVTEPQLIEDTEWTPNQQAARRKIIDAAADLIAEHGLAACTVRSVADASGLTKSTVHYYFEDANELVDLSVNEIFRRISRHATPIVVASDGPSGLEFLVRLFLGHGEPVPGLRFRDSMLWPAYTAHAWKRGAAGAILQGLETLRAVFQLAIERGEVPPAEAAHRSNSVHNYLLGAMIRNMIEPLDRTEVACAVTALTGITVDADRC